MPKLPAADPQKAYSFSDVHFLNEKDVLQDPIKQFEVWFKDAFEKIDIEAYAMSLATCSKDYKPSVRTVLLKKYDEHGFVFYTNYSSRKANELEENSYASLLFYWKETGRQIRIEGNVTKVSREESEEYFHSRPFESQIAAIASDQSSVIESRDLLEKKYDELELKYKNITVPLPGFWGGFRLIPDKIEFWQGRQNRMHDRILFTKTDDGWRIERLAP